MKITEYLVEKSNGLLKIQPEINDWTNRGYQMFNTGSVEVEVAEFLYGLVRMLKPGRILDTGTHYGISALYMGQALKDNGENGIVISLEHDRTYAEKAQELWGNAGLLNKQIFCEIGNSLDFDFKDDPYDLMFLDTEPQIRFQELVKFYPHLKEGGFVFLHDLPRGFCKGNINPQHPEIESWPWGKVPEEMNKLLSEGKLTKWHFPNPREMAGFYRVREDDYKWGY